MSPRSPLALALAALSVLAPCACSSSDAAPAEAPAADAGVPTTSYGVPLDPQSPWPKFRGNAPQDGRGRAHASATGGARWAYPTAKGIFSSPVVGRDGTVYIGSADRTFYALGRDGTLRWKELTGEIIDSAALLDDRGRVTFGSGDGKLRSRDAATGAVVWTTDADDPKVNKAFINWFEGNVAIGRDGALWVPNDDFFVYRVDRDTGAIVTRLLMPDQTWSSPAIDVGTGAAFVGNNNLLPLLGKNTFAFDADGGALWSASSLGSVAASPLLTPDGHVVVGGFDGYVRAYDAKTGAPLWATATRDHVYASPALLPDGRIVQPSCDGTIYALAPDDGHVVWQFDTREPIRSSPAVDADGNVYVGSGEGRLFVLTKDGALRFARRLISGDRNDLNASPALGDDAVFIAGESGEIFSVPYDDCLRPDAAADATCIVDPKEDLPDAGAHLLFTTSFGALLDAPPAAIDANQALAAALLVREAGDTRLAILDPASVVVTIDPPADVTADVAGDGKFVTVTPTSGFTAGADGKVHVSIAADYLVDLDRDGLKLSGGKPGGSVAADWTFTLAPGAAPTLPLPTPHAPGDAAATWELARLALPLPTILPSYNQIGFDSLHYLIGLVELDAGRGVAWMAGAKLADGENRTVIDPATKALMPLAVRYDGGLVTLTNDDGVSVEITSAVIPFRTFRIAASLSAAGDAAGPARISGSTVCAGVPFYGPFLQKLGLCNPQTDVLTVFGGAILQRFGTGSAAAPTGLGQVAITATATEASATFTGATLPLADHVVALFVVDAATGEPVTLGYGLSTTRETNTDGSIARVAVPWKTTTPPAAMRVYVMIDTYPAAVATLSAP